jgi:predicted ABC-type ATPase
LSLKKIIIIAGPNGAGKTTFAQNFLPVEANLFVFINADLIAEQLESRNPATAAFRAGRQMLEQIDQCVIQGVSFAFETTLSGVSYLKKIERWQQLGYVVKLWFLSLPSEEIALARVAQRVKQGGHGIQEEIIRRRFKSGLRNFVNKYAKAVDSWAFYDNSGLHPKLMEWKDQ